MPGVLPAGSLGQSRWGCRLLALHPHFWWCWKVPATALSMASALRMWSRQDFLGGSGGISWVPWWAGVCNFEIIIRSKSFSLGKSSNSSLGGDDRNGSGSRHCLSWWCAVTRALIFNLCGFTGTARFLFYFILSISQLCACR